MAPAQCPEILELVAAAVLNLDDMVDLERPVTTALVGLLADPAVSPYHLATNDLPLPAGPRPREPLSVLSRLECARVFGAT